MSAIVPAEDIERIVGAGRHVLAHLGRAVSAEQTVYILHSKLCLASTPDLRECRYSRFLDYGIDLEAWEGWEDKPVQLMLDPKRGLIPLCEVPA